MYARMIENAQFDELGGLRLNAGSLDEVEKLAAYGKREEEGGDKEYPYRNLSLIFNKKQNKVVGAVDPNFALVQHGEVLNAIGDGVKSIGFPFKGATQVSGDGTYATGVVLFTDTPKTQVTPGEVFQFGVEWRNSVDGSGALSLRGYRHRLRCSNGATSTEYLGEWSERHTAKARDLLEAIPGHILEVLQNSEQYEKLWAAADAQEVRMNDAPLILNGVGFPKNGIMDVIANIHTYEPTVSEKLTRARLYEAANYWSNHVQKTDVRSSQKTLDKLSTLLETDITKLVTRVSQ